jgi:cytochrome c-type biogenesis protein
MLGAWRWVPWLQRDLRPHLRLAGGNPLAAYVIGMAFAFGWTPCIGPVLGAILAFSAAGTSAGGVGLLTAYALGLGVPFLAAALLADRAAHLLARLRGFGVGLQIVGGVVLVALGLAMMTNQLAVASLWLLERMPALGTIG